MHARRFPILLAALGALLAPAPVEAQQQVVQRGWVLRTELATGTIYLRTRNRTRTVQLRSQAVIVRGDRLLDLVDLPRDAHVEVLGHSGPFSVILADRLHVLWQPAAAFSAAVAPDGLFFGEVTGIHTHLGSLYLRTPSGIRLVPTGTAPILVNGRPATMADIPLGAAVAIQREPAAPWLPGITSLVAVFPGRTAAEVARDYRPLPTPFTSAHPTLPNPPLRLRYR